MTEDEAKTKWCPKANPQIGGPECPGNGNRFEDALGSQAYMDTRCIASACMAWRSISAQTVVNGAARSYNTDSGYCGLAGKP